MVASLDSKLEPRSQTYNSQQTILPYHGIEYVPILPYLLQKVFYQRLLIHYFLELFLSAINIPIVHAALLK